MSELHSSLLANHLFVIDIEVGFQAEWSIKQGFLRFKYGKTRSESAYNTLKLLSLRDLYKTIQVSPMYLQRPVPHHQE
jgi:hypothetical protein